MVVPAENRNAEQRATPCLLHGHAQEIMAFELELSECLSFQRDIEPSGFLSIDNGIQST